MTIGGLGEVCTLVLTMTLDGGILLISSNRGSLNVSLSINGFLRRKNQVVHEMVAIYIQT
jgi:hypothetical protein